MHAVEQMIKKIRRNHQTSTNPLTPELPQHGVPRPGAPRHNIILAVFRNFQADISSLREYIKDLQADISALREFVTVGEAVFSASRSERVKPRNNFVTVDKVRV